MNAALAKIKSIRTLTRINKPSLAADEQWVHRGIEEGGQSTTITKTKRLDPRDQREKREHSRRISDLFGLAGRLYHGLKPSPDGISF